MAISCSGETSAPRASVFSKIICDFTARKASRAVLSFSRLAVLRASLMVFSKLIFCFFLRLIYIFIQKSVFANLHLSLIVFGKERLHMLLRSVISIDGNVFSSESGNGFEITFMLRYQISGIKFFQFVSSFCHFV